MMHMNVDEYKEKQKNVFVTVYIHSAEKGSFQWA